MKIILTLLAGLLGAVAAFGVVMDRPAAKSDPGKHHLIYLHGAIVTGSDGRPVSEYFGPYEYRAILERFDRDGFVVISEIRKDDTDLQAQAGRVMGWIAQLKLTGVPGRNISVVGASLGGIIGARVSAALADPEITYVLIASLYEMRSEPVTALHGRVLSIHDESDNRAMIADKYFAASPDLTAARIVVTHTGLGHGLLYTPHDAWCEPAKSWILTRQP